MLVLQEDRGLRDLKGLRDYRAIWVVQGLTVWRVLKGLRAQ